jgi:predicted permease
MLTGLLNDIRFAVRGLVRAPSFTAIAVLTLALGIGVNTAVFTLVDGVLIQPLPFDDAADLIAVRHLGREGRDQLPMSQGLYVLYREQAATIEEIGLYAGTTANLVIGGEPERVPAQSVTPSFFGVLGVQAVLGRTFLEEENAPGADPVVILSDGLWHSRFGADPEVIGQTIDLNGRMRTIVGVMAHDFGFPDRSALLWAPLQVNPATAPLAAFGAGGVARMAPGESVESVYAELAGLIGRLAEIYPESGAPAFLREVNLRARVLSLKEALVGDVSSTLWILLGTVGFVLLIACANVANLLLVRAEGRQRELALRMALGAGRGQVLRWFLSESILLASLGGIIGAAVASAAVRVSLGLVPTDIPRLAEIGIDFRVGVFTAIVTLGCALFFGLFPLLRGRSDDLAGPLQEGSGRGATMGRQRHRLRNGLVIVQMALALVLLVGSGLMLRSFQALRALDPGFEIENILTARIIVPGAEIEGWEETAGFFRQLGNRMRARPGVEAVGFALSAPLAGGTGYYTIQVEDHPRGPEELPVFASNNQVEYGYLESMGIRLLEGRTLQPGDGAEGTRSVVISKSFAEHWWPDRSPIGRRMRIGFGGEDWYSIVGVAADAHYLSLEGDPEEMVYWPATLGPAESPQATRAMDITIKTAGDPLQFVSVLRQEVRELNPRIPVSNPRTMEDLFAAATSRTSFTMALLSAASMIALLLGLVGIYGVISYIVSQRTREFGVRLALGATGITVRGMVVKQGLILALAGVAIGLVAAGALSSVMSALLYGVHAIDPLTYAVVAFSQVLVALLASWLPAHRAASVDPARALRAE